MSIIKRLPKSFTVSDEYFNKRISLSKKQIEDEQNKLFRQAYFLAWDNVRFYQERFKKHGLSRNSVTGIKDIDKLPFMSADDIIATEANKRSSSDFLAVPQRDVSLVHTSSGTTGRCKVLAYTGSDIINWASNVATCFWIMGFRKNDIFVSFDPFGEYTGGGGLYLGLTMLGVTYIPISVGPGVTEKVVAHITGKWRLGKREIELDPLQIANAIGGIPSFVPRIEEVLNNYGLDPSSFMLRKGAFGAEPWSEAFRNKIEKRFGIDARDMYGLGEFLGPGVAAECGQKKGLHVLSDAFIAEVIDPKTGQHVRESEEGELVLTSLKKEAMPFLRYRTGDRTVYMGRDCGCGIKHQKIGRISGRMNKDEIILPGGVVVKRVCLEEIILSEDGLGTEYKFAVLPVSDKAISKLHIVVEGDMSKADKISASLTKKIQVQYNHQPIIKILPQGKIPRNPGKAKRIFSLEEYNDLLFNGTGLDKEK